MPVGRQQYMIPATQAPLLQLDPSDVKKLFGPVDHLLTVHQKLYKDLAYAVQFADEHKSPDETPHERLVHQFIDIFSSSVRMYSSSACSAQLTLSSQIDGLYKYVDYTRSFFASFVLRKEQQKQVGFYSFLRERELYMTSDDKQYVFRVPLMQPEMKDFLSRLMTLPMTRVQHYQAVCQESLRLMSDEPGGRVECAPNVPPDAINLCQGLKVLVTKLDSTLASAFEVYRIHKEINGQSNVRPE